MRENGGVFANVNPFCKPGGSPRTATPELERLHGNKVRASFAKSDSPVRRQALYRGSAEMNVNLFIQGQSPFPIRNTR
jgi:hypothetical protein